MFCTFVHILFYIYDSINGFGGKYHQDVLADIELEGVATVDQPH